MIRLLEKRGTAIRNHDIPNVDKYNNKIHRLLEDPK